MLILQQEKSTSLLSGNSLENVIRHLLSAPGTVVMDNEVFGGVIAVMICVVVILIGSRKRKSDDR